jgi:hypothetical protein
MVPPKLTRFLRYNHHALSGLLPDRKPRKSLLSFDSSGHGYYVHSAQGRKILGLNSRTSCWLLHFPPESSSFLSLASGTPQKSNPRILAPSAAILISGLSSCEPLTMKEPDVTV